MTLEVIKRRLIGMPPRPTLHQCFGALGFEWRTLHKFDDRGKVRLKRRSFEGRKITLRGAQTRAIFQDTVTAHCVLHDCREYYRRLVKLIHPDVGGDAELMRLASVAWARVRELFARRRISL